MKSTLLSNENYKIGNDVIYLPNFEASLTAPFIRRVYTENEKEYCTSFSEPTLRYASTFAAKEAVYKVLKQWDEELTLPWNKIAIERNKPGGKPAVTILIPKLSKFEIALSISHDGAYIWAIALLKTKQNVHASTH